LHNVGDKEMQSDQHFRFDTENRNRKKNKKGCVSVYTLLATRTVFPVHCGAVLRYGHPNLLS